MIQLPQFILSDKEARRDFISKNLGIRVVDTYEAQLNELCLIRTPKLRFSPSKTEAQEKFIGTYCQGKPLDECGVWLFLPWSKLLVHCLAEADYQEVRTARNRNLITLEEQQKFASSRVAIAGLSVGSHAAFTISMMGGAKSLFLADPDTVSVSNLNRVEYGVSELEENKCVLAARRIYEQNPYADLHCFVDGVNEGNIQDFFGGSNSVHVLVEETDNLAMKIILREEARRRRIPVIMATDNADGVIVDVERFDLEPTRQLFHGAVGDLTLERFQSMDPSELPALATRIAGPDDVALRMLQSVAEVGKTLYSWPQLGNAATVAGASIAYLVKALVAGKKVQSGKYQVNFDSIFDSQYVQDQKESHPLRHETLRAIGLAKYE